MKEEYVCQWIWKKRVDSTNALRVPIRIPKELEKTNPLKPGNYVVKIYKLIPEEY